MRDIILETCNSVLDGFPRFEPNECWRWATATRRRLDKISRACIQAGSASFPMFAVDPPAPAPTHFSYVWEITPKTITRVLQYSLPEMHVWVALPDLGLVVDVTTGFQRENAKMHGCAIEVDLPKIFVGDREDAARERLLYHPKEAAMRLLGAFHDWDATGDPSSLQRWLQRFGTVDSPN